MLRVDSREKLHKTLLAGTKLRDKIRHILPGLIPKGGSELLIGEQRFAGVF